MIVIPAQIESGSEAEDDPLPFSCSPVPSSATPLQTEVTVEDHGKVIDVQQRSMRNSVFNVNGSETPKYQCHSSTKPLFVNWHHSFVLNFLKSAPRSSSLSSLTNVMCYALA
ncbi:hypothetical protein TNCV_5100151 [Trichonephila clavipes]|uniref:Uncharacterized protein n=1 Tax=Trichonephila clavipes TaxID=2585209 RepID=A0A8X6VC81_TRICX|nr:hypothetical protein TNCV_5100151 [Trichonephila clavipes]